MNACKQINFWRAEPKKRRVVNSRTKENISSFNGVPLIFRWTRTHTHAHTQCASRVLYPKWNVYCVLYNSVVHALIHCFFSSLLQCLFVAAIFHCVQFLIVDFFTSYILFIILHNILLHSSFNYSFVVSDERPQFLWQKVHAHIHTYIFNSSTATVTTTTAAFRCCCHQQPLHNIQKYHKHAQPNKNATHDIHNH